MHRDSHEEKHILLHSRTHIVYVTTVGDLFMALFDNLFGQGDQNPWIEKGKNHFNQGRYEEAARDLGKALEISDEPATHYLRGEAFFYLGEAQQAAREFRICVEKNPEDITGWESFGESLLRIGSYKEALKCYDVVTTHRPNAQNGWLRKTECLERLARYTDAAAAAEAALNLDPDDRTLRGRAIQQMHSLISTRC